MRFSLLFALAHAGAFAACLPVLTILVPLKAAEIDPVGKASLLSWTVLLGALTASFVNIIGGALSDRTKSRFGRRRPWILGGAAGTAATYFLIWRAASPPDLFAAIIIFQIAFNLFLPALVALLPDEVPDRRKGRMAALMALGPPLGLGIGAMLAGAEEFGAGGRYMSIAGLLFATIAPLLLCWKEPASTGLSPPERSAAGPVAEASRSAWENFARVWTSRLFIQIGVATSQAFILFFVASKMTVDKGFPDAPPETVVGGLLLISTSISIATALAFGAVSDFLGQRKYYVSASGVMIFIGMATFALSPTWHGIIFSQVLYGLGAGLYSSADVALAAERLPSRYDAARDLGILNLGNTLPQAIAPGLALLLVDTSGDGYPTLFLVAGAAAAFGGLVAARIR